MVLYLQKSKGRRKNTLNTITQINQDIKDGKWILKSEGDINGSVKAQTVIVYGNVNGGIKAEEVVVINGEIDGPVKADKVVGLKSKEEQKNKEVEKICKNCKFYKPNPNYLVFDGDCLLQSEILPRATMKNETCCNFILNIKL